ncbi:MAG: methyltransferase domain-containing protein, partial [Bdellovibrionales bacterium]|nr:methyltransferase domain-containing protein [Bdellovibrionales bacterium]
MRSALLPLTPTRKTLLKSSSMQYPFPEIGRACPFDFIIMNHVLEHVANPIQVIRDAYQVLRRNGH